MKTKILALLLMVINFTVAGFCQDYYYSDNQKISLFRDHSSVLIQ